MKKEIIKQIISALSILYTTFAVGLVMCYPGMVLQQWKDQDLIVLSESETAWFASVSQLMAIPGCLLGGYLIEKIGSRYLVLVMLPLFGASWIATIQATFISPIALIFARGCQGLIGAMLGVPAFVYPCEIAEPKRRGFLGTLLSCIFSLSFLLTYTIGGIMDWQIFSYICIGITVLPSLILVYAAVESPLWLARKGRESDALKNLRLIRCPENIDFEIKALKEIEPTRIDPFRKLILKPKFKNIYPMFMAICLVTLREISGYIVLVVFLVQICEENDSSLSPYFQSILIGTVRLICNMICSSILDRVSRKSMIIMPCLIASFSLFFLSFYFNLKQMETSTTLNYLPLICLLIIEICYSVGINPVSALLTTEIQLSETRCLSVGFIQASFSFSSWLSTYLFVVINQNFGIHTSFTVFAFGCISTGVFAYLAIPETNNKSLSEIENHWLGVNKNWHAFKSKLCCLEKREFSMDNIQV